MPAQGVKGVILCGGKGVRLRPLTFYFQKTMIPIGRRQKPLLEYVVRLLAYHGIGDIVMLVGYKSAQIVNYFDDGSRFNVNITYVEDEEGYSGTGGALLNAYHRGVIGDDDTLLIYYGDILSDINLSKMIEYHRSKRSEATLAVSTGYKVRVGVVETADDNRIISMVEKPVLPLKVGIGILALEGATLSVLEDVWRHRSGEVDLMGHLLPRLISENRPVYAYVENCFWYDVGSTERYEKLDNEMVERVFDFLFKSERQA